MPTPPSILNSSSTPVAEGHRSARPGLVAVVVVSLALLLASCADSEQAQSPISLGLDETPTTTGDEPPSNATSSATPVESQTEILVTDDASDNTPSSTESSTPSTNPASSTTSEGDNPLDGTTNLAAPGQRSEWEGLIDGDIGYTLWLAQDDDRVRGEITYNSVGTPITVLGQRYDGQNDGYYLREYGPDGTVSGLITLLGVVDGEIAEAGWGEMSMTAVFVGTSPYSFDAVVRAGEYRYTYPPTVPDGADRTASEDCCGPSGVLLLSDIGDDSIWVRIESVTSGPAFNLAIVPPTELPLSGNRARYDQTDSSGLDCAFEIIVYDGFAFIDYIDDRFDCQFGNRASVVGMYVLVG